MDVSVDAVCAAAGCSKGAFFHHFATRDEFVLAALAGSKRLSAREVIRVLPALTRDGRIAAVLNPGPRRSDASMPASEIAAMGSQIRRVLRA
jgi:AcrR family transcriptional regulator